MGKIIISDWGDEQEHIYKKDMSKYPFKDMQVGDTFFVPYPETGEEIDVFDKAELQSKLSAAIGSYKKYNKVDRKFKTSRSDEGVTIIRIE